MRILVINPGSTSTKFAVYEGETPLLLRSIRHKAEELAPFKTVLDQFEFRYNLVMNEIKVTNVDFNFKAVIGRGGLGKAVPGGVYEINEKMLEDNTVAQSVLDTNWKLIPVQFNDKTNKTVFEKPAFYDTLLRLVQILCVDFSFVCVEFCSIDERIYFKAMDFTPHSGLIQWYPADKNLEYGNRIPLLLNKKTALPEKSFIKKGIPRLPVDFVPPKTDEEIRQDIMRQKDREIALKKDEIKKKNEEIENLKINNKKMKDLLNDITHSKSFAVGEILTKPVKKLKDFFDA